MTDIKNSSYSKVNIRQNLNVKNQNGTIEPGSTAGNFPINISSVSLESPNTINGSFTYPWYPVYKVFENFSVIINGNWNSKIHSGQTISLRKGNIISSFKVRKSVSLIDNSGDWKTTIYFYTDRVDNSSLDYFIGNIGYPSTIDDLDFSSYIAFNVDMETCNSLSPLLKSFTIHKNKYDDNNFNALISWETEPSTKATRLRWRPTPIVKLISNLYVNQPFLAEGNTAIYSHIPVAKIVNNTGSNAKAIITTTINDINVVNNGINYTYANVDIIGDGVGASATAVISGNSIIGIDIASGGTGYSYTPQIIISGDGSGASAEISSYETTGLVITDQGGGYLSKPTLQIDNTYLLSSIGASASIYLSLDSTASVNQIKVENGGYGYQNGVTININGSTDVAIANATIIDGVITSIDIAYGGKKYDPYNFNIDIIGLSGGSGAFAKGNLDVFSEWTYEEPLYIDKQKLITNLKYNVEYEVQILVSDDENFRGISKYSSSQYFSYVK